jgi:ribonuclease VapC
MFVDASAIIAIIAAEDDAVSLAGRLSRSRDRYTSAVAIFEAAAGLARIGTLSHRPPWTLSTGFRRGRSIGRAH